MCEAEEGFTWHNSKQLSALRKDLEDRLARSVCDTILLPKKTVQKLVEVVRQAHHDEVNHEHNKEN